MKPLKIIPAIHRAAHGIAAFLAADPGLDVTQAEALVLAHLAAHGDSTVGQIHNEFGHKRSTLTSILNRLEERGLITCLVNPKDRRSLLIGLTPSGQALARKVHQKLAQLETESTKMFKAADRANALAMLTGVTRATSGETPAT